ncbi:helix-turn-helix domain-containing protein [Paenibacillus gansuensis]|uniref:Helix-turn-helix domain-containing protein n=1 Tax=Paenibacillus gansuensis TaxID=306542 RepID=A0ABW5PBH1_9BACL
MERGAAAALFPAVRSVWAGSIVYPPGGRYGPRVQQDIQLVLLHTGMLNIQVDGEARQVQPGTVILLKPGHHEMFYFAEEQSTWHRWISIELEPGGAEQKRLLEKLPWNVPISEELNRLTDVMLSLQGEGEPAYETLKALGISALELFAAEQQRIRAKLEAHPSVAAVKREIQNSYAESWTLRAMAEAGGVSPEHLVRLFQRYEQVTPMKFLWNYRVLKAQEMLAYTGLSISEIAERCGFQTSYHFARSVKQRTGLTPSAIRAASWEGKDSGRQQLNGE